MSKQELRFKILKILDKNPQINQRELAQELGISLGKANYCLRALVDKGLVKAERFRKSSKKLAYLYVLTPNGIETKAKMTIQFLKLKLEEYETIKSEIEELKKESKDITI